MQTLRYLTPFLALIFTTASATADRAEEVRKVVETYMAEQGVVGCSIAIGERGEVVFEEGFGYSDLENLVTAKPETIYRLASISKSITATSVMQLVEQGKIDLDADIRKYVPEFPEKKHIITTRHILSHLSGIRHYKDAEVQSKKRYTSVEGSLAIFKEDPLLQEPGETFSYSTYGYTLLARLVEKVSGEKYPDYLRKHIFDSAGMSTAGVEDLIAIVPNRARGYMKGRNGEPRNSNYADISYKWGGGGLVTSAPDLCRFGIAIINNTLTKEETRKEMWTEQKLNDGSGTRYGLGWSVRTLGDRRMFGHSGAQQMVRTLLMVFPDDETVIAILTNYENHDPSRLGRAIAQVWFEEEVRTASGLNKAA